MKKTNFKFGDKVLMINKKDKTFYKKFKNKFGIIVGYDEIFFKRYPWVVLFEGEKLDNPTYCASGELKKYQPNCGLKINYNFLKK